MRAKKVEKDEVVDYPSPLSWNAEGPDVAEFKGSTCERNLKPKRRNGRHAWKPKALQAERMASMYYWMGLVLSVIMFILGINVGLYAF